MGLIYFRIIDFVHNCLHVNEIQIKEILKRFEERVQYKVSTYNVRITLKEPQRCYFPRIFIETLDF